MGFQSAKEKIFFFSKKNKRYLFIVFVFMLAILFYSFTAPTEVSKKNETAKKETTAKNPDLDAKHTEKAYPDVIQSQSGDVFRVGAYLVTKENERIEIFVRSLLDGLLKVGEWELAPSENGEYKELVFSTPGRYKDVIFRLRDNGGETEEKWDDSAIYVHSFFLTRVRASNDIEIRNLKPTLFGLSTIKQQELFSEKNKNSGIARWVFQAQGDFLQALEFSGKTSGNGRQQYTFELFRYNQQKEEKETLLRTSSFILDELNDLRVASGNYQIPFSFLLRDGQWYEILLKKDESTNSKNSFNITSLATDNGQENSVESGNLALHVGVRTRANNNADLLDRSRFEDFGESFFYSFSLQRTLVDYTNLSDASNSIVFDKKKRVVVGGQKNGEFFMYTFDTLYPFDQLALQAIQMGNDEKEIKLEYSFDNAFWKEIPFQQEKGGPQKFSLILSGGGVYHVLSIRASYNGEEKKSGFFALETLQVNASVPKP